MRFLLTVVLSVGLFTLPCERARAYEPEPKTGLAGLVVGPGLVIGGMFAAMISVPICTSGVSGGLHAQCAAPLLLVGSGAGIAGLVGIGLGIKRRRVHNAWRRDRAGSQATFALSPTFRGGGFGLALSGRY